MSEEYFGLPPEPSLEGLPDPNGNPNMEGEVLPDDWTPDGDC